MPGTSIGLLVGFLVLVVNGGYLFSSDAPHLFYATNVLLHAVLGVVIVALALRAWPGWKKKLSEGRVSFRVLGLVLAATAVSGLVLIVFGSTPSTRWLIPVHVVVAALSAILVAWQLRTRVVYAAVAIGFALPVIALVRGSIAETEPTLNASLPPTSMEGESMGGEEGPFFPSSAETADGKLIPSRFFLNSEDCGRCHTDIYDEWESSAHRKASFNNQWYRKSVEYMQSVVGTQPSKWCGGCHDHAILFTGMMDEPVATYIDRPEAHAGISCTSCHSIVRVKDTMGNGGFVLEYPALHDLATSKNPFVRAVHDFILHLDPEPHRKTFLKPLHTGDASAFCSTCHKVHLDVPVNHYRWFRGFNTYDNWQASGVSGQGARSFYYPDKSMTCTECHMPSVPGYDPASADGLIPSHRFAAANTALPTAYGDEEQLKAVKDFLQAGQVSVDLFALVRSEEEGAPEEMVPPGEGSTRQIATTFAVGEEAEMVIPRRMPGAGAEETLVAPLDAARPPLVRGESVRIDAVVRTRTVGHFFPSGTVDAFDLWLALKATDNEGRTIFWSGVTEDDGGKPGPVDPSAHFYRAVLLDAKGQPINKRNAWSARSSLYAQLIPPGAANTVRFRLNVPKEVGSEIRFEAKLNYRKFAWWNTQWAYAGERVDADPDVTPDYDLGGWRFSGDLSSVSGELKEIPDVPIVTMAEASVVLPVVDELPASESSVFRKEDRGRWNDYGIGLLLQGDLKAAERAFLEVTKLDPEYADGWVNVGRVRIQEGDHEGAREVLKEALNCDPNLAKTHYFYGLTLKSEGRYGEAIESFRRAAESYPRDRVVRNQIGRIHFLEREYDQAIEEFQKTLRIDPEDLEAHYNLMLAYQGTGDTERSDLHKKLYLRFKADEASQSITGDYRRTHPADNNERLPIHEHRNALEMP